MPQMPPRNEYSANMGTEDSPRFRQQVLRPACREMWIPPNHPMSNTLLGDMKQTLESSSNPVTQSQQPLEPDWSFLHEGTLFGRDDETRMLQEAWLRRIDGTAIKNDEGRAELVLVSGKSGTGKSALVKKAMQEAAQKHNGYFCMGKFDQLTSTAEPYGPFVGALTQLAVDMELAWHRDVKVASDQGGALPPPLQQILDQVGLEYCQILGSIVPSLARLLRLPSSSLEYAESVAIQDAHQDRLKIALTKFFMAIEQPIAIVMDDLQWACARSLDLVDALVAISNFRSSDDDNNKSRSCLIVVGICRSNEVPWDHNFAEMLRQLEDEKNTHILHIVVENLSRSVTNTLVSRVLKQPPQCCVDLTNIIYEEGEQGNVFFMLQLMKTMFGKGVLFVKKQGTVTPAYDQQWLLDDDKWDELAAWKSHNLTLDVVTLVSQQIQSLPDPCQRLLKKMACLGAEVEFDIIATALRGLAEEQSTSSALGDDEESNVIDDSVREIIQIVKHHDLIEEELPHRPGRFAFRHDSMQQAAYSLIPEDERPKEHLLTGRTLLQQLTPDDLEQNLFIVVNQLVLGIHLLTSDIDKVGMSELCVRAGKKATKQADYVTARDYFDVALSLLPPRFWRDEYHLTLDLFCSRADAERCAVDFDAMNATVNEVFTNCRSPKDRMRASLSLLSSLGMRAKIQEARDLGFQLLASLGVFFPSKPRMMYLVPALLKLKWQLRALSDEDIYHLPMMDAFDTDKAAIMTILSQLIVYTFCDAPDFCPFVILRGVALTLKHGLCPLSCSALASFGSVLCAIGEYDDGYRYAALGLKLLERFPHHRTQILPRLYIDAYGMVFPWKVPVGPTIHRLQYAQAVALDAGDFESAVLLCYTALTNRYIAGDRLSLIDHQIDQCTKITYDHGPWLALTNLERQFVDNLMGRTKDPLQLAIEMDATKQRKHDFDLYNYSAHTIRLQLSYHFGNIKLALKSAKEVRKLENTVQAMLYATLFYIYDGMAAVEAAHLCKGLRRRKYLSMARQRLKKLKLLSKACPENIMHKAHLLCGEFEALHGRLDKAAELFAQAIDNASERGMWQFLALAHERAAVAYQRLGKTLEHSHKAEEHLSHAISAYSEWGAFAVVSHLEEKRKNMSGAMRR